MSCFSYSQKVNIPDNFIYCCVWNCILFCCILTRNDIDRWFQRKAEVWSGLHISNSSFSVSTVSFSLIKKKWKIYAFSLFFYICHLELIVALLARLFPWKRPGHSVVTQFWKTSTSLFISVSDPALSDGFLNYNSVIGVALSLTLSVFSLDHRELFSFQLYKHCLILLVI